MLWFHVMLHYVGLFQILEINKKKHKPIQSGKSGSLTTVADIDPHRVIDVADPVL